MIALFFLLLMVLAVAFVVIIAGLGFWLAKRYTPIWSYIGAGLLAIFSLFGVGAIFAAMEQAKNVAMSMNRGYYELFAIIAAIPTGLGFFAMLGLLVYGVRRSQKP